MRTAALVFVVGCVGHGMMPPGGDDVVDPPPDPVELDCPGGHREKLKFERLTSCANDGSVEFCIPDQPANLEAALQAIASEIRCAPGGGRAGCNRTPGLLLCSYPTQFPDQCTSQHGAMTDAVWSDMCAIATLPEVTEIVPTFFE